MVTVCCYFTIVYAFWSLVGCAGEGQFFLYFPGSYYISLLQISSSQHAVMSRQSCTSLHSGAEFISSHCIHHTHYPPGHANALHHYVISLLLSSQTSLCDIDKCRPLSRKYDLVPYRQRGGVPLGHWPVPAPEPSCHPSCSQGPAQLHQRPQHSHREAEAKWKQSKENPDESG